jgi:hypothetical protein
MQKISAAATEQLENAYFQRILWTGDAEYAADDVSSSSMCISRNFLTHEYRIMPDLERLVVVCQLDTHNKTWLCELPSVYLPTYSPFAIYDMKLQRLNVHGCSPPYDSAAPLDKLIREGVSAEWKIVWISPLRGIIDRGRFTFDVQEAYKKAQEQPYMYTVLCEETKHLKHCCEETAERKHFFFYFPALDRLGVDGYFESGFHPLTKSEDPLHEIQAATKQICFRRRRQWLRLCATLLTDVCAGVTMRERDDDRVEQRIQHIEGIASTQPWRLFVNGLIDTNVLLMHLRRTRMLEPLKHMLAGSQLDVDPECSFFWQNVAQLYAKDLCLIGPAHALTVPQQRSLTDALCSMGLMYRRSNDGALVSRTVFYALEWLKRYVMLLQRMRCVERAGVPPPNSCSEIHSALQHRDVLLVETALPLSSPVKQAAAIQRMRDAALVCLSPVVSYDIRTLRDLFCDRMTEVVECKPSCAYFPMVVIEDAQWWSAHALQFWLMVLHTTPQFGRSFERYSNGWWYKSTGSGTPFKLVVCYSTAVEDSGVRDLLLGVMPSSYVRSCSADGFPSSTRAALPDVEDARATLLCRISAARESSMLDDVLGAILTDAAADIASTNSAIASISDAARSPDMFVVRSAIPEAAVYQLSRAGYLPRSLMRNIVSHDVCQYEAQDVVAIDKPVTAQRLTTLLCLMDRVVVIA